MSASDPREKGFVNRDSGFVGGTYSGFGSGESRITIHESFILA
jgi:hypothetical protein